jgi:hypothetical protein
MNMAGEIGFINVADAELYFSTRLFSTAWTSIVDDSGKTTKVAALTTAYDRLFYSGLFTLPSLVMATAAELVVLKKFQCEMALYLLIHLADEDRRLGLQAQGVTVAGIVKEQYKETDLNQLPIPAFITAGLSEYSAAPAPFYAVDIDRDEDESVNTDVTDY